MKTIRTTYPENRFCQYCGKEILSIAKYCSDCGYEIPESIFYSQIDQTNIQSEKESHHRLRANIPDSRVTKKKGYRSLIILIVFATLFIYTNPNEKMHFDFVKEKIREKLNSNEYFEPGIVRLIKSGKDDEQYNGLLKDFVKRKNFVFFSLTEVKNEDKLAVISIGILGNIIDLEKVDSFFKKPNIEKGKFNQTTDESNKRIESKKPMLDDSEIILLVMFGVIVFVWLLPILTIVISRKTKGGEKLAWVLAVVFISWFAFIFYLLLAPIKKKN